MRMGNYFWGAALRQDEMAAKRSDFGVRHVTVVPTNFESTEDEDDARRDTAE